MKAQKTVRKKPMKPECPVTETDKVREIKGNTVISPDKSAACFGCMNSECMNTGRKSGRLITAENPGSLPLEAGQKVEAAASGASLIGQTLTAFLPPALGFIAGFFLTRLLLPEVGEGAAAFAGVILLFAAAFVVYRATGKRP